MLQHAGCLRDLSQSEQYYGRLNSSGTLPRNFLPEFRRIIFPSFSVSSSPSRSTLQGPTRRNVSGNPHRHTRPLLLLSGCLTPDNLLQPFAATSFPYLTAPLLYFVPCSLECEHFAILHKNAFPFFQHNIGNRPVHDLDEYHGPHHTTPGFQHNGFPYPGLGHNRPEQDVVRNTGGPPIRYPSDGRDIDHTKTPPSLLPDKINGQYPPQQL